MTLTLNTIARPLTTEPPLSVCPDPAPTPDGVPTPNHLDALDAETRTTRAALAGIKANAEAVLDGLPTPALLDCQAADDAIAHRRLLAVIARVADVDGRAARAAEHEAARPAWKAPEPIPFRRPDTSRDLDAIVDHLPAGALDQLHHLQAQRDAQLQAALPALIVALRTELEVDGELARLAEMAAPVFDGIHDPVGRAMDALYVGGEDPVVALAEAMPVDTPAALDIVTNLMNGAVT